MTGRTCGAPAEGAGAPDDRSPQGSDARDHSGSERRSDAILTDVEPVPAERLARWSPTARYTTERARVLGRHVLLPDDPSAAFERLAEHHGGRALARRWLLAVLAAGDSTEVA